MVYYGKDGLRRGKRGGISSRNTREDWANYYQKHGHSPGFKYRNGKKGAIQPPADTKDPGAFQEYLWIKENQAEVEEYGKRGYDPNDPNADLDIEMDMEDGPY